LNIFSHPHFVDGAFNTVVGDQYGVQILLEMARGCMLITIAQLAFLWYPQFSFLFHDDSTDFSWS
jgi:hypothetical protein